jgi:hypothetical protein
LRTSVRHLDRVASQATKEFPARRFDVFAEWERERAALRAANKRLQASNADLRRMQLAVAAGFDALDDWTDGVLRGLVERSGDELAALVDLVLDACEEDR